MESQGGVVRWTIEADSSNFHSAVEDAKRDIDSLTDKANQADAKSSKSGLFGSLFGNLGDTSKALGGIGSSLAKIGWGTFSAGATGATAALTSLVSKGIQATDFLETSRTAMSGLTGSIAEGNKAMSIAANYWQNNPFQRFDVTNATKQLVQFGRNTSQIGADLETLGKVSLSTGVQIDELARYYARTSASGRAMTMDLEMMSDRGIPIYRELTKQLGTTTAGVREMASKGKIDFETFRKAMEGAVDAEAMKQFEQTLSRQVDRFKGSISILAGDLAGYKIVNDQLVISANGLEKTWTKLVNTMATGLRSEGMREGLAKIGQAIADLMQKIFQFYEVWETQADGTQKLVQHSKTLETVFGALSKAIKFIGENSEMLLPILGGVLTVFGKFGSNLPVIGPIIGGISENFGKLKTNIFGLLKVNPILGVFLGLFGAGFLSSLKNSEEFRQSIAELMKAVGRLTQALVPAGKAIVNAFTSLASSGVVTSILKVLVDVLTALTNVIASFPTSVLTSIITSLLMFKLLSVNPILGYATAIMLIVGALKNLAKAGNFNVMEKITSGIKGAFDFIKSVAKNIVNTGHNIMVGLYNGLVSGSKTVISFVKSVARSIINTFKGIFQIHSPSKVMSELGGYITLGLAEGITDNESVLQHALDSLATSVLSTVEKVIQNKYDFGIIDYNGMYKDWKKASDLFTKGSQQYVNAIEKMEEARKQVNLRIIQLQENYNDKLDETIKKIGSMQNIFQKADLSGGMDSAEIIGNLDKQVAQLQQWASAQEIIAGLDLDPRFIEELQDMGVDAVNELQAIAQMTSSELSTLNQLWLKKQQIANDAGVRQMAKLKNETLNEIKDLKSGIDGETVEVKDVGGRLVANIGEGVYGAIPTLQEAYQDLDKHMKEAAKKLGKSGNDSLADAMEDAFNPEDVTPTVDAGLDEIKNDIGQSLEEAKQSLLGILGGVVGGIVAFKFGPKILKALGGTKLGSKIGGVFKDLFGKGQVAKDAADAAKDAGNIAKSTETVSGKLETVSTEMTKGQKMMKTIREGAYTIIAIAAAIAAMAVAIRVAYEALKEVDWVGFASSMGMVATAVVAMSAVAKISDKLGNNWKGVAVIIGLAADLAVMAVAIRVAYEALRPVDWPAFGTILGEVAAMIGALGILAGVIGSFPKEVALGMAIILGLAVDLVAMGVSIRLAYEALKPVNWPEFGKIIGQVSATIGALGVLAGIIGAFAAPVALGMAIILGLCVDLIAMAASIRLSYEALKPIGWDEYGKILGEVSATIGVMGVLAGVIGVFAPIVGAGVLAILGVAEAIRQIADALRTAYNAIPDDLKGLNQKMDLLKEQLGSLSMITGVIGLFMPLEMAGVTAILGIAEAVRQIAQSLFLIDIYVPDDLAKITAKVELVKYVIQKVAEADIGQVIGSIVANINVGIVTQVIDNYVVIAQSLQRLYYIELDADKVEEKVGLIQRVVNMVAQGASEGGFFQQIANIVNTALNSNVVDNAANILRIYSTLGNSLNKIQNIDVNFAAVQDKVREIQKIVQLIIDMKGDGGIFGAIGNFFTGNPINEEQIERVVNILKKMAKIATTVNGMEGVNVEHANQKVGEVQAVIGKIGEIKDPGGLDTKEWIIGMATSMAYKLIEFLGVVNQLGGLGEGVADYIKNAIDAVWAIGQVNTSQVDSLATKEWVIGMGVSMARKLGEFDSALSGMSGEDKSGIITATIGNLNNMFTQINTTMSNQLASFENLGKEIINKFTQGIKSGQGQIIEAGNSTQHYFWQAIENKMNDEYQQGATMARKFAEGLKSVSGEMTNAGNSSQHHYWKAIQNKMNDEYNQGKALGERFRQGLYDVDYGNAGWWAAKGFEDGAKSRNVYSTGWKIADKFLQGLKDRGRQGSPWKTTIESGNWAVEGLIEGIKDSEGALINEATTLADEVIDALSMDNLTLAPSLDASYNTPTMGSRYTPVMSVDEQGYSGTSRKNVIIEQTNNNYTQYSLQQINKDLAWELAKI